MIETGYDLEQSGCVAIDPPKLAVKAYALTL